MISRRRMLGGITGGFLAYAMRHQGVSNLLAATPTGTAKRCLVLWMEGGPSQLETFDPKSGTDTGGPTKSISTSVPGIAIAETLPSVAKHMHELAVLRNITSNEGDHFRGTYYLHTGYKQVPGFPRPSMGSVLSHATPVTDFPKNVTIGGQGFGPAFLGLDHAPFSIDEPNDALEMLRRLKRRRNRLDLIQSLSHEFDRQHVDASVQQRSALIGKLQSLVNTPFVDALDISKENTKVREAYGDSPFAQNCLLARRLLEAGVNYVEVQHGGWDTHNDNFAATRRLGSEIDQPWAALLTDLKSSGMLDETLVVWMGEFGRTPVINANGGRDHFPTVTPVVLTGGGITGGHVVGATNISGTAIEGESHSVADLFATIYSRLGIDLEGELTTEFGAPTSVTDDGEALTI